MERESMEFDVVIVGAGPAGLDGGSAVPPPFRLSPGGWHRVYVRYLNAAVAAQHFPFPCVCLCH